MNIARLRAETPGAGLAVHFNNAGAALPPQPVVDSVMTYLREEALHGGYEMARLRRKELRAVYDSVARLLDAAPQEIALVESATVAWNRAFRAVPFQSGDNLICSPVEYASNYLNFLRLAEDLKLEIRVAPSAPDGDLDPEGLERLIDEHTRLIAITHVPTNGGLVNPAEEVGAIARRRAVLYLLDACQSAGQLPLDVERLGCDFLSATGRKYLRGPRGTGFLYVREASLDRLRPASIDLGSAVWDAPDRYHWSKGAKRFETWECSLGLRLGLGTAVDYALNLGLKAIEKRIVSLAETLRGQLAAIPGLELLDLGKRRCGIVCFRTAMEAAALQRRLEEAGFHTSVTAPESTRIDADRRGLGPINRASVHYYNTVEEVERFGQALERALG